MRYRHVGRLAATVAIEVVAVIVLFSDAHLSAPVAPATDAHSRNWLSSAETPN
jgi:hypothetical protein